MAFFCVKLSIPRDIENGNFIFYKVLMMVVHHLLLLIFIIHLLLSIFKYVRFPSNLLSLPSERQLLRTASCHIRNT